ncbi:hypothetical protein HK100_000056 [Physocladia obscura]|uniref:Aromatic-L-amino-acid decarboxylase n=1 Tax=Physocladia obscura TaxID=109957 RepID=A0AAD5XC37_9FUNG|nr:hypothetical protein HK100_000056 [Physocladia obscura]
MDPKEFRRIGHETVERIAQFYEQLAAQGLEQSDGTSGSTSSLGVPAPIPRIPVLSQVQPGYLATLIPSEAPETPEPWSAISSDIEQKIMPGITHWQSPNFFAFFPSNSSFPGILGEMYSAMFNSIGFNWQTSPAYTELEQIMCNWLAKAIGLGDAFLSSSTSSLTDGRPQLGGGIIQGSASEAIVVAIIAARQKMIDALKTDETDDAAMAVAGKLIAYGSTQTHSATKKGAMIAGVRFRALEVDPVTFSLHGETVTAAIQEDLANGLIPFYITATIGTTSSGAVDDIPGIVQAASEYNVWVNVDAAWAGSALVCAEYRHLLAGVDGVDSFSFNMHKWMLTNFDCSPMWVKNRKYLTNALSISPAFLRNAASSSGLITDYRDWQLPLGRRFRSLKIWFVVRTYGLEGIRAHIRKHIQQCIIFENHLLARPNLYKIVTQRSLALITFSIVPPSESKWSANDLTNAVCDAINADGEILVTHTVLNGVDVIRFVPGGTLTTDAHIVGACRVFDRVTAHVLSQ